MRRPFHDIGKIGIPDRILQKPGKLDTHELVEMRKHVQIGVDILQDSTAPIAAIARSIISRHHERWDGTGYPTGLKGCDIPVEARVVAVADVLDALCSNRPYKKAWTPKAAFQEIVACSGTHFDPDCVNALQHKWPEIRPLLMDADVNVAASAQTDDE